MRFEKSDWITSAADDECPVFVKAFSIDKKVKKAVFYITSIGVYHAELNGKRIGDFVMAPGWTNYKSRLQYQEYDVTDLLEANNRIEIIVGRGWQRGRVSTYFKKHPEFPPASVIVELAIGFMDGTETIISSDKLWQSGQSRLLKSDIFDGEVYDALYETVLNPVVCCAHDKSILIPQEGELVKEHERFHPVRIFAAPNGEQIVDFGQNITGYPEIVVKAKKGEIVDLSFGEVLDADGNFYNANYRGAKAEFRYVCDEGFQIHKPLCTFYGFQYVRINTAPECFDITAVAVYSDLKRTGFLSTSNEKLDKLFSNILWSNKDNFLDIPTDCPQRDEGLGWTGDAQVFAKTACYNFDSEKFFMKWLADLVSEQGENGFVPHVIPDALENETGKERMSSAAWGDVAVILPWQLYLAYGDREILKKQFGSMCKWISYITETTTEKHLWTGGEHFGDWLGIDSPYGSYKGASRDDFIASAYYAYSTYLMIKSGRALGEDVSYYEELYKNIVRKFRETYPEYKTQTECVLALYFDLADDKAKTAKQLNEMIFKNGNKLMTGFVGTPYLLHALSENGYVQTAYSLLLQEDYPSWLYSVNRGATTIWEHWDGIRDDGTMWSTDMNSFNHYAYGAVADWVYSVAAGIRPDEEKPGYEHVIIAPLPDKRLGELSARFESRRGTIISEWKYENNSFSYYIVTPVNARVIIDGVERELAPGEYRFGNS